MLARALRFTAAQQNKTEVRVTYSFARVLGDGRIESRKRLLAQTAFE